MNEEKFWQLIQQIDRSAFDEGDMDGAVEPLVDALGELPVKAIKKFEEILAKKLYALDGKVFADNAGEPGNSGDGFLYARCYVVGGGQATYDCVVAAPT